MFLPPLLLPDPVISPAKDGRTMRARSTNFSHLKSGLEAINPDLPAFSNTDKWQGGMEQSKGYGALKAFPHLEKASMLLSSKFISVCYLFCGDIKGSKKCINSSER